MHKLSTALRRLADTLEVTEPQAAAAYLAHTKAHGCAAARCPAALKLHDAWKRAEAQQGSEARAQRRGVVRIQGGR